MSSSRVGAVSSEAVSATSRESLSPPMPLQPNLHEHWLLDRSITFLNHGSFGSAPRIVLEAQSRYREQIEQRPIEMLGRRIRELLTPSHEAVAQFIHAEPSDVVFIDNATSAINGIVHALRFSPGDEILTTSHVYNAIRQVMRAAADRTGCVPIETPMPFPIANSDAALNAIAQAITPRTRLIIIDHVTSPTALVLPLKAIIDLAAARGIDVLVDGAHAPGMIELDVPALGAAYYTGNLHKWVCAPKGCAFLWVRKDRQAMAHPTTISHFYKQGFLEEYGWQGTRDITAWMAAGDALRFMSGLAPGGWSAVREHNHAMASWVQRMLTKAWEVEATSPIEGRGAHSMIGSMVTVPLPSGLREKFEKPEQLAAALYEQHRIEIPVLEFGGRWYCRASCQVYNVAGEYERLRDAVVLLRG